MSDSVAGSTQLSYRVGPGCHGDVEPGERVPAVREAGLQCDPVPGPHLRALPLLNLLQLLLLLLHRSAQGGQISASQQNGGQRQSLNDTHFPLYPTTFSPPPLHRTCAKSDVQALYTVQT